MLSGKLSLDALKSYCSFIFQQCLAEFVREDIKRNREVDLPVLKFFSHLSDDEIFTLSKTSITKFLTDIIENRALQVIAKSMEDWKADKLPGITKHSLKPADISLIFNTRKHTLLKFLPRYTTDYQIILKIVNEIEDFYTFQTNLAIQTYADINQEQLMESKNKLKEAQVMANLGNWEYNQVTGQAYWSDQLYSIYGLKKEDYPDGIDPDAVRRFLREEDLIQFRRNIQDAVALKRKYSFEFTIIRTDGESRILSDEGYSDINNKGESIVKGITQDITEKKHTEERLKQRERFIAHIAESTPDVIYVYDLKSNKYVYQNKEFSSLLGYSDKDVHEPLSLLNTIHPDDKNVVKERNDKYRIVKDGEVIEDELRFADVDGNWRWINFRGMILNRNKESLPLQLIGTARDVTREKNYQAELISLNQDLKDSNEILKVVQEELQASNEELAESNTTLEERVKQRTTELTNQREYLLSILKQAPAAIAILRGPELVFELVTPLYLLLVGRSDLLGKPVKEAIPELTEQGFLYIMEKVYETGNAFQGNEYQVMLNRNDSGKLQESYFNFVIVPLKQPDGSIEGVMIHAVEVTMQVIAAKEAKENAEKFELVLESIPPIAWTALPEGNINYFSQRWYDYTGLDKETSMSSGWEEALHPDDILHALKTWENARINNKPLEAEHRFKNAVTQEYRWHVIRGIPLKNINGDVKLWVGTCTDIHDIKKYAQALLNNEKQLRLITNNIPAFVSYVDKNETYVFANKYYNNIALTDDSMEGKTLKEVLGSYYQDNKLYLEKVLKGEEVSFLTSLTLKDQSIKKLEVKYVPDFGEDGAVKGFVVLGVDLTERLEIESTLEKKNADLIKINSDLDNFIYTASHDLKSPVSNIEGLILSLCDMLEEKTFIDYEINEIIEMVNLSIKRFQNTINDLTEISKTQRNIHENTEWIHIKEIFEEVKFGIDKQIKDAEATILADFNCSPVNFSRINLKSIFYNLLSNSIKYSSPLRKPVISVKCSDKNDSYCIEVQDNGLGLKQEYQAKIFGMFKRFHDHVEGSGVGLYLVKRIVDNVNGSIEVESNEGEGTTFRIYLPKILQPDMS